MVYFGKIVVFRSHPVNRHKVILRVFFIKKLAGFYSRNDLINEIKRSGKNIKLVPGSYGKGVFLRKCSNVSFYLSTFSQILILFLQYVYQCFSLFLSKLLLLIPDLGFKIFYCRELVQKRFQVFLLRQEIGNQLGKRIGLRIWNAGYFHFEMAA